MVIEYMQKKKEKVSYITNLFRQNHLISNKRDWSKRFIY